MKKQCPVCDNNKIIPIFKHDKIPRYNNERNITREKALQAQTEKVDFCYCAGCQFLFNRIHDSSLMDYLIDYEVSRRDSKYFNEFITSVFDMEPTIIKSATEGEKFAL